MKESKLLVLASLVFSLPSFFLLNYSMQHMYSFNVSAFFWLLIPFYLFLIALAALLTALKERIKLFQTILIIQALYYVIFFLLTQMAVAH